MKYRSAQFVAVNSESRHVDVDNRSVAAGLAGLAAMTVLVAVALMAVEFGLAVAETVVTDELSGAVDGDLCFEAVDRHPLVAKEQSEPEAGPKEIVIEVMAAGDFFQRANTLSRLVAVLLFWLYAAMVP